MSSEVVTKRRCRGDRTKEQLQSRWLKAESSPLVLPNRMAPTPELFTSLASFQPTLSAKIYDGSCLWLIFWLPLKLGGHHLYQCDCLGTPALSRNDKGVPSVLNHLCLSTRLKALSFMTLQCERLLDKIGMIPEFTSPHSYTMHATIMQQPSPSPPSDYEWGSDKTATVSRQG